MTREILISTCAILLLGGCSNPDESSNAPARHANETGLPRHVAPEAEYPASKGAGKAAQEVSGYQDMANETTSKMKSQTEAAASYFEE